MIWASLDSPSNTTEFAPDALLDIKELVDAKLSVTHPKTQKRVEGFDNDRMDQLFARLLEMSKAMESEGLGLHELSDEEVRAAIRLAADEVAEATRRNRKPDKCPA